MAALPTTATVANPRQAGYDGRLDDLLLRFASAPDRPLRITTAPKQSDRLQTEQTAEDFLPEYGQVFSRNNFTGGEGLDFAYRAQNTDADTRRYWESKGIDISITKPGALDAVALLHSTGSLFTSAETNLYLIRLPDGTIAYADGNQIREIALPNATTPTRDTEDPHTGTEDVTGLASLGDEMYAACGTDGIGKRTGAGSWSDLASATTTANLWAVKGRILTDSGAGVLAEIDLTTGAPTTLLNLGAGDVVNAIIDPRIRLE